MGLYARGSEKAFNELFHRFEGRAYRYFLRRVRSEGRARDLYQELFLRLHRFRETYDPARAFEPWFFHIARHVLIDEWRQQHRRAEVALTQAHLRSQVGDAESDLAHREAAEHALQSLSPENARMLVDAKVRGLEHAEIAAAMSKSIDAVKQSVSRSLRRLREAHALPR
jgi:RNA polymerase sigma-70 factor (ECF subfamily)